MDSTGSAVPNASVDIKNVGTGEEYKTTTNSTGFYSAPSLFAGNYTITVHAQGMAEYAGKIELNVGETAVVNPQLKVGSVSQQVTVAGDVTPLVTYNDQTVSTTLEYKRVNQLPLNGRNIATLVGETTPGVEGQYANGNETQAFEYIQDGAVLQDRDLGYVNLSVGGGLGTRLPDQDSIEEVRVETTDSSAKFDRPATAIITTRAGTNALHGTAFETARNNGLGIAKNRQDTFTKAPKYIRNEFGVSAGGPIYIPKLYNGHNRSFFFVAYERYSLAQGVSEPLYEPTMAMRAGDFSGLIDASTGTPFVIYDPATSQGPAGKYQRTAFTNNQISAGRLSPLAKTLFALEPQPTNASDPLVQSNLTTALPNSQLAPTITARVDQHFNEKDSAYLRYTHERLQNTTAYGSAVGTGSAPYQGPVLLGGVINDQVNPDNIDSFGLSETHIFSPTFYAETLLSNSWERDVSGGAGNQNINYASQYGLPNPFGQTSFPGIAGSTAPGAGNNQGSILNNFYNGTFRTNSQVITSLDENITKIVQRHQLEFGGRIRHERLGYFSGSFCLRPKYLQRSRDSSRECGLSFLE